MGGNVGALLIVGDVDGEIVGIFDNVGLSVGIGDGAAEGFWVSVGLTDGDLLGMGEMLGLSVGEGDGFSVGLKEIEGPLVGAWDVVGVK